MPGITGIVDPKNRFDSPSLLKQMLRAMRHEEFYETMHYFDPPIALGRIHLGVVNPEPQPIFNENQDKCIVMNGEIYGYHQLRDKLRHNHSFKFENDPELVLHLYEEYDLEFPNFLDGSFVSAIWDAKKKELIIANDRYGLLPLYYTNFDGGFIFAPEVKGVIEIDNFPRILNEKAVADFFSFGYILGDKTFFKSIRLLPPASIFVVNGQTASFAPRKYWDLDFSVDKYNTLQRIIDTLHALLKKAVNVRAKRGERLGIALSGGIDSRAILAAMDPELIKRMTAFTGGVEGTLDAQISRMICQRLEIDHKFYEVSPSHLRDNAKKAIYVTDGMYMLHHAYGTYRMYKELKKHVDIVYVGTAGEMFHGGYLTRDILNASSQKELVHAVLKNINSIIPLGEQKDFFSAEYNRIGLSSIRSVQKELEKTKSTSLANKSDYFFLTNRVRRFINMGLVHLRTFFECRLPFFDKPLIDYLQTIHPRFRFDRYLLKQLFMVHYPVLSKIPLEDWESPLDSNPLAIRLKRARRTIRKRLYRRLQAISRGKILFKDYHQIIDINYWFRTDLRDFIESILLDPQTLRRPYFNPRYIENMVRAHMVGKKDLADPLGALVTFELWHRMFMD